jgi:hypothetical protein
MLSLSKHEGGVAGLLSDGTNENTQAGHGDLRVYASIN